MAGRRVPSFLIAPSERKPVHSMVLLILDEIKSQSNDQGGGWHDTAAEKSRLAVIVYNQDKCEHILHIVAEQYVDININATTRQCTNTMFVQTKNFLLLENVNFHIKLNTQPTA